jgi:hypothetical protein
MRFNMKAGECIPEMRFAGKFLFPHRLFNDPCSIGLLGDRWWWTGKVLEGSGRGLIEVLARHLHGGIEENHETLRSAGVAA